MADVNAMIQQIQGMKLSEDDKNIMISALKEKGEDAVLDVLTLLELKAKNADLAASVITETTDEAVADVEQASSQL